MASTVYIHTTKSLIIASGIFVVIIALWLEPSGYGKFIVYPATLLADWVHDISQGVSMALLYNDWTRVESLVVGSDGRLQLVTEADYFAAKITFAVSPYGVGIILSVGLIFAALNTTIMRISIFMVTLLMLATTVAWATDTVTLSIMISVAFGICIASIWLPVLLVGCINFVTAFCIGLHWILNWGELFVYEQSSQSKGDTAILADLTFGSGHDWGYILWGLVIAAGSSVLILIALRRFLLLLRGPIKAH